MFSYPDLSFIVGGIGECVDCFYPCLEKGEEEKSRKRTKIRKASSVYSFSYDEENKLLLVGDDLGRISYFKTEEYDGEEESWVEIVGENHPSDVFGDSIMSVIHPLWKDSCPRKFAIGHHSGKIGIFDSGNKFQNIFSCYRNGYILDIDQCGTSTFICAGNEEIIPMIDFTRPRTNNQVGELGGSTGHKSVVNGLKYDKERDITLSVSDDYTLCIWSMKTRKTVLSTKGISFQTSVDYDSSSHMIAVGDYEGRLDIYDIRKLNSIERNGVIFRKNIYHESWIPKVQIVRGMCSEEKDKLHVLSVGHDGKAHVVSLPDLQVRKRYICSDELHSFQVIVSSRNTASCEMIKKDLMERVDYLLLMGEAEHNSVDFKLSFSNGVVVTLNRLIFTLNM